MPDLYVSSIVLAVNGQNISDFKSVTPKAVDRYKAVKLMGKTGFIKVTPRYAVDVEYVLPETGAFDWSTVSDGTLTITESGGKQIVFTGVFILTEGDVKYDAENEATMAVSLGAAKRTEK